MSSREIADLTGKRHDHVLRDIDVLLKSLPPDLGAGYKSTTYVSADGRTCRQFEMDRDSTICLVTGYDATSRMRIIKRWQELEEAVTTKLILTPYETAGRQFEAEYRIWNLLQCPVHIAQQEIVKSVRKNTGIDFGEALIHAAAQQNILPRTEMLEPTEIGKHFNIGSAIKVNKILEGFGLQTNINGDWEPTVTGRPHCQKHVWTKKNKSGYNLKWNLKFIESYLNPVENDSDSEESDS